MKRVIDEHKITLIRGCYWLGILIDALAALDMTIIGLIGASSVLSYFFSSNIAVIDGGIAYRYAMVIGAALMWGWTGLLVWADRKPAQRIEVLLLTCPVVICMIISSIIAGVGSLILIEEMVLRVIIQGGILSLFFFSYVNGKKKNFSGEK